MSDRRYPDRPFVGIGGVIVHEGRVVLVKRRFEPLAGQWGIPGGAVETGEIKSAEGRRPERRLGHANDSDPLVVDQLPDRAQRLVNASVDLYARIKRLDEGQMLAEPVASPARALMGRLERDLIWNRT